MIMKKREIIFSIIFLILSYYIIVFPSFLTFEDKGELILFVLLIIGGLYLTMLSMIELIQSKQRDMKNKIIDSFCFISSLIFVIAAVYSIIVK